MILMLARSSELHGCSELLSLRSPWDGKVAPFTAKNGGIPMQDANSNGGSQPSLDPVATPQLSLPKGGGAIRGIGEKFAANPATGGGSLTVPIYASAGRAGFEPHLALSYDSGSGNGVFGFGWSLSLPSIARKTDKGLPTFAD